MTREHVIAHIFFIIISETYLGLKKNIKIPVYADDVMLWTNNAKQGKTSTSLTTYAINLTIKII